MPALVSVLIPAYNVAAYLPRAIDSALAQAVDLEVIIVDDASVDATVEVARAAAERDARVRVLHHARNQGISATLNDAMAAATGDWLAVLGADDAWLPDRLERLLLAESGAADAVSDDLYRIGPDGRSAHRLLRPQWPALRAGAAPIWLRPHDALAHDLGWLKPVVRRRFVMQHGLAYDPALPLQEDFHFNLALLLHGARWLQVPEAYYLYFVRAGSASANWFRLYQQSALLERTEALRQLPAVARDPSLREEVERYIRRQHDSLRWQHLRAELRRGDWSVLGQPGRLAWALQQGVRRAQHRLHRPAAEACVTLEPDGRLHVAPLAPRRRWP